MAVEPAGTGFLYDVVTAAFNDTAITNTALAQLRGLKRLEMLHLHGTTVTDADLAQIAELKLRHLWLDGSQVTDDALATFQQASPNCHITH